MSFAKNYNNNETQPVNVTYSPVMFSSPESPVAQTRFSISYFNKLLKVTIAPRNNAGSNDPYATYDTDNSNEVYVSYTKAKMLYDLIERLESDPSTHNVCIELKGGLLKVSDGSEYGSDSPCISITSGKSDGSTNTIIYQTKSKYHKGAINYNDDTGDYKDAYFDDLELQTFSNVLFEYWKASTYAVAATVMEAGMYKRNADSNRIYAIAEKVGAIEHKSGNSNQKSFLNDNNNTNSRQYSSDDTDLNGAVGEYESATFEDIANAMAR